MMAANFTKLLLVTANVGSIFEDPDRMLKIWIKEFVTTIQQLAPDFLALHCQEVGGKNYEESMQHVNFFVKSLLASEEMQAYDRARVFLDEDFTAVDKFTALGNMYFVHQSVPHVQIYNFHENQFVAMDGQEVLSGNIENVPIKEKAKFPQEFFPECKWSRKGFIRTRWNVNHTVFDLVNIHLFHDASNIIAMESSPSLYVANRQNALRHTIERFDNDEYESVPYFMFGDFNFRLDTHHLVKKLTENLTAHETKGKKNELSKIEYTKANNGKAILTVEKKGFDHHDKHDNLFFHRFHWLRQFDREVDPFRDKLLEYNVTFPPSYPFSEDLDDGTSYMKTRCPAWCDRIFMTDNARNLLVLDPGQEPDYKMIGHKICMGDHKPIYLNLKLRHGSGKQDRESPLPEECPPSPYEKKPLKKVISINGEEVADIQDMNIHENIVFEREQHLASKFLNKIRRQSDITDAARSKLLKKQKSFSELARDVIRVESVLMALQHYAHRSDTESDSDDETETKVKTRRWHSTPAGHYGTAPSNLPRTQEVPSNQLGEPKEMPSNQLGEPKEMPSNQEQTANEAGQGLPQEENANDPTKPSAQKNTQINNNNSANPGMLDAVCDGSPCMPADPHLDSTVTAKEVHVDIVSDSPSRSAGGSPAHGDGTPLLKQGGAGSKATPPAGENKGREGSVCPCVLL